MERWFRDLSQKQIRRGSFDSVDALLAAIAQYLATYNAHPTRFTWTKDADMILAKIDRCKSRVRDTALARSPLIGGACEATGRSDPSEATAVG